jgi:hypothetical protein
MGVGVGATDGVAGVSVAAAFSPGWAQARVARRSALVTPIVVAGARRGNNDSDAG